MIEKQLVTDGNGKFTEIDYQRAPLKKQEIAVKTLMTGICRSDIDMMQGKFQLLPNEMHGHEGLGEVIEFGEGINDVEVGDIVATRGEPAYADSYNVRQNEYVRVPEADPKYILEPVACGVNIITQNMDILLNHKSMKRECKLAILGTGFLAQVVYQTLDIMFPETEFDITVFGKSNPEFWGDKLTQTLDKKFDVVVDLNPTLNTFELDIFENEALIILGTQKTITTDFANVLWKACTIACPSPRTDKFHFAMKLACSEVSNGSIDVSNLWTKGYDRDTEWQQAFDDAVNRPKGYSRGYIKWR